METISFNYESERQKPIITTLGLFTIMVSELRLLILWTISYCRCVRLPLASAIKLRCSSSELRLLILWTISYCRCVRLPLASAIKLRCSSSGQGIKSTAIQRKK
ncbi:uncharacterized protein LOC133722228 [Rosa rugosa]|uniref:uncharacterized protein LOC133722228 n=1 Tax=Rosa rugosa TaxID=74645 RepID=UPI002B4055D4|nr:uncharacterized protein LOC133722228 [Rosa rugosa]